MNIFDMNPVIKGKIMNKPAKFLGLLIVVSLIGVTANVYSDSTSNKYELTHCATDYKYVLS